MVIEPNFGNLTRLDVVFPHPDGLINLDLTRDKNKVEGTITMPGNLSGEFKLKGKTFLLRPGKNDISTN